MRRLLLAAVVLAGLSLASPARAADAGVVVPHLDFTAVGGLGHEIRSGWSKPVLFASETVLGPHYGPIYLGGLGLAQSPEGGASTVVPIVTYVAQGYVHGWFRGVAFQVGQRRPTGFVSGTPGYYFLLGVAR